MSQEEFPQFTQEEFKEYAQFLSKEDFETKLKTIIDLPNLYHQKDELLNTEDLDQKAEEYVTESEELFETVYTKGKSFFDLIQLISQARPDEIRYTPNEPLEQEEGVFYVTDEMLFTNGEQLKYSNTFMGLECSYFYTGSIEDGTDSGFSILHPSEQEERRMITIANPDQDAKILYMHNPYPGVEKIINIGSKRVKGRLNQLPGTMVVTKTPRTLELKKLLSLDEPCFTVTRTNGNELLYGEFSEKYSEKYSSKAVMVTFDDHNEEEVVVKQVGEYSENEFTKYYRYCKERDMFKAYRLDEDPDSIVDHITYRENETTKYYKLSKKDIQKHGLDRIKGFGSENLSDMKLFMKKFRDPSEKTPLLVFFVLCLDMTIINLVEVDYENSQYTLSSLNTGGKDGEFELRSIQEIGRRRMRSPVYDQIEGNKQKGLMVTSPESGMKVVYEGEIFRNKANGLGRMTMEVSDPLQARQEPVEDVTSLKNGAVLTGYFIDDQLNDLNGKIEYAKGSIYEGM